MAAAAKTLQEQSTSLTPQDVLAQARDFFTSRNPLYATFVDMEGPGWVTFRGQGGEEIVVAAASKNGATLVTASTYLFDMQVSRFVDAARGGAVSALFATQLRSGRPPIFIASGPTAITIRVEASDLWETVRVTALPGTPVSEVKQKVVAALFPAGDHHDDFVLKLRGWEMLDARASLADAGVVDGSILLLAYRRRRPVR